MGFAKRADVAATVAITAVVVTVPTSGKYCCAKLESSYNITHLPLINL